MRNLPFCPLGASSEPNLGVLLSAPPDHTDGLLHQLLLPELCHRGCNCSLPGVVFALGGEGRRKKSGISQQFCCIGMCLVLGGGGGWMLLELLWIVC